MIPGELGNSGENSVENGRESGDSGWNSGGNLGIAEGEFSDSGEIWLCR